MTSSSLFDFPIQLKAYPWLVAYPSWIGFSDADPISSRKLALIFGYGSSPVNFEISVDWMNAAVEMLKVISKLFSN